MLRRSSSLVAALALVAVVQRSCLSVYTVQSRNGPGFAFNVSAVSNRNQPADHNPFRGHDPHAPKGGKRPRKGFAANSI